jgi:hypothetical protein
MLSIGQKVEIGFNPMPPEERTRLEQARSTGRNTSKIHESKIDQEAHQTQSIPGEIEGVKKGSYIVRVFLDGWPNGRLREYPQDTHLLTPV